MTPETESERERETEGSKKRTPSHAKIRTKSEQWAIRLQRKRTNKRKTESKKESVWKGAKGRGGKWAKRERDGAKRERDGGQASVDMTDIPPIHSPQSPHPVFTHLPRQKEIPTTKNTGKGRTETSLLSRCNCSFDFFSRHKRLRQNEWHNLCQHHSPQEWTTSACSSVKMSKRGD